jgi:hypothetical protein
MRIQLYDRGTPRGKKLFADIEKVCQSLQVFDEPEYIKDMNRPYSMGLQGEVILMINNEPVLIDKFPNLKELENLINEYL